MREESLLTQVRLLTEKHEALAVANGQNFNLFAVLDRETDEVRTHSAMLAELLNPSGTHGQKALFLRAFAEQLELGVLRVDEARVWSEVTIGKGSRADILLEIDDTMVVIENKIHADDQPTQLQRYHSYASQWPKSRLFYLTLHGERPSSESLGKLASDKVTCISYEKHVLAWLDVCIKEVARLPQIREILAHYEALLRKLTGKSTGELTMDIKELLGNKQGDQFNFELAPRIAEAMTEFSIDTEWGFWETLKDRLLETKDRPWCLELVDDMDGVAKTVNKDVIRHAHGLGNKDKWDYGWTVRVKSKAKPNRYCKQGVEVLLRVECSGWGWGFYRIIAVEQTEAGRKLIAKSDAADVFGEWEERVKAAEGGWYFDSDKLLAWAYPRENVPLQKRTWLEPDVLRRMLDGADDLVEIIASELHTSIDRIEGVEP